MLEVSEIHNYMYIAVAELFYLKWLKACVDTDMSSLHSTGWCVLISLKHIYILPKSLYISTDEYSR